VCEWLVLIPAWAPESEIAGTPRACTRHRHQGRGDGFASRQQGVHLAFRRLLGDLGRQPAESIGGVTHRRYHHHNAGVLGAAGDALGDPLDPRR